jgi:hypothetical protein
VPLAIVSGALANKPFNGGNAWTRLSLLLGLRRLGFEVFFIEQRERPTRLQRSYLDRVLAAFAIPGALVEPRQPTPVSAVEAAEAADVLVNIGGHLTLTALKAQPRHKIFLDDDPGYLQLWQAAGLLGEQLAGHDAYFTYGTNVGRPHCPIPTVGLPWRPTFPAVVLEQWPQTGGRLDRFTTVASWRGPYGRAQQNGRTYGVKAHEFRKLIGLPRRVEPRFEIALEIDDADVYDRRLLEANGWLLVDPRVAAGTPQAFRDYVLTSGAEFSVAQGMYVETGSGWFSDRTTRYLAAGKPVLVQDTGFSRSLPVGDGLLVFRTQEEAVSGVKRIAADYAAHSAAARALAEGFFDSDRVLADLLAQ